jgi:hypothetical protein
MCVKILIAFILMLRFFQVATFDNWGTICRINMYGCDIIGYNTGDYSYDAQCSSPHGLGTVVCLWPSILCKY